MSRPLFVFRPGRVYATVLGTICQRKVPSEAPNAGKNLGNRLPKHPTKSCGPFAAALREYSGWLALVGGAVFPLCRHRQSCLPARAAPRSGALSAIYAGRGTHRPAPGREVSEQTTSCHAVASDGTVPHMVLGSPLWLVAPRLQAISAVVCHIDMGHSTPAPPPGSPVLTRNHRARY